VPRKSGHTCNAGLTIMQNGARCPDLSGPGTALLRGHEIKKTSPGSFALSFFGASGPKTYALSSNNTGIYLIVFQFYREYFFIDLMALLLYKAG